MNKTENNFRLRGLDTTRLDTFIDAAFAFATTMLVISIGDIPKNFEELILAFKGIPAFLASFVSVLIIWLGHRKWSRRYGIENIKTIILSLSLIFLLLIYVYPLRLVFSALFAWISGGFFQSEFIIETQTELTTLFILYGLGFAFISLILGLLYYSAKKYDYSIKLNKIEIILTNFEMTNQLVLSFTAFLSSLFALIMPLNLAVYAGFVYFILPVLMPIISIIYQKKIKEITD